MKPTLLLLTLFATTSAAIAQTTCPPPVVKVLRDNQEIPATGAAFAPKVTLLVSPDPACAPNTFRFREAEVTLMRGPRPALPTLLVKHPEVDLTALTSIAQPGDRIHVFIWYKNLYLASADGKLRPYPHPALNVTEQKGISANLVTDEAKGISFNWLVLPK